MLGPITAGAQASNSTPDVSRKRANLQVNFQCEDFLRVHLSAELQVLHLSLSCDAHQKSDKLPSTGEKGVTSVCCYKDETLWGSPVLSLGSGHGDCSERTVCQRKLQRPNPSGTETGEELF